MPAGAGHGPDVDEAPRGVRAEQARGAQERRDHQDSALNPVAGCQRRPQPMGRTCAGEKTDTPSYGGYGSTLRPWPGAPDAGECLDSRSCESARAVCNRRRGSSGLGAMQAEHRSGSGRDQCGRVRLHGHRDDAGTPQESHHQDALGSGPAGRTADGCVWQCGHPACACPMADSRPWDLPQHLTDEGQVPPPRGCRRSPGCRHCAGQIDFALSPVTVNYTQSGAPASLTAHIRLIYTSGQWRYITMQPDNTPANTDTNVPDPSAG